MHFLVKVVKHHQRSIWKLSHFFVGCIIGSFKKVWQSLLNFHPHLVQHCIEAVINSRLKPSKPPPISGLACVALRKPLEDILLWIPKFSFCLWPSLFYICLCLSVFVFIWHGMCRNAQTPWEYSPSDTSMPLSSPLDHGSECQQLKPISLEMLIGSNVFFRAAPIWKLTFKGDIDPGTNPSEVSKGKGANSMQKCGELRSGSRHLYLRRDLKRSAWPGDGPTQNISPGNAVNGSTQVHLHKYKHKNINTQC